MDEARIKFYLNLTNPILNKLWEIVTFREFILDRYSNDEIYFYLHYRYIIFKGSQLEKHESSFQAIMYINWDQVENILLSNFIHLL